MGPTSQSVMAPTSVFFFTLSLHLFKYIILHSDFTYLWVGGQLGLRNLQGIMATTNFFIQPYSCTLYQVYLLRSACLSYCWGQLGLGNFYHPLVVVFCFLPDLMVAPFHLHFCFAFITISFYFIHILVIRI